ncbi:transposase [Streptomyces bungoensis]
MQGPCRCSRPHQDPRHVGICGVIDHGRVGRADQTAELVFRSRTVHGDSTVEPSDQLRPYLPVSIGRCGRWRDHRQVIDGNQYRVRTWVQWRDLPERFKPWKAVYERHRLWSADGTGERVLQHVQAAAAAADEIDWGLSVDFTTLRAHHHAAGARTEPATSPSSKGGPQR